MLVEEIAGRHVALEKAAHRGVPTLAFGAKSLFDQDRIEITVWRMEQKGLAKR